MDLLKDVIFDKADKTPLYIQIADFITNGIAKGHIKMDERLPSINVFSKEYGISRDTVEKAYKVLKKEKTIVGRKGKGLYINRTALISKNSVLFLINKLSPYKLKIYNAFVENVGSGFHTNFEIYHCDESLFLNLMEKNNGRYDYYVIMPHFKPVGFGFEHKKLRERSLKAIEGIPKDKLIIMDNNDLEIEGDIIEIYQDFEMDIYNALKSGLDKIKQYKRVSLVMAKGEIFPYLEKVCYGFMKFCNEHLLDFRIVNKIEGMDVVDKEDLFIVITDEDLVKLLDLISIKGYDLGTDVGVVSYNETPFKRLLDIAVISTDFKYMGETLADMLVNDKKGKVKNPFRLIDRGSF